MSKEAFKGILAIGRTKQEAANRYQLASLGKGAVVKYNEATGLRFVTHASGTNDIFDPMTGDMDLKDDKKTLARIEFASESSNSDLSAFHAECADGCGAHLVFEDPTLVNYCPKCTSKLSLSTDDLDDTDEDVIPAVEGDDEDDDSSDDSDLDLDSDSDTSESGDDEDQDQDEDSDEPEDTDDDDDLEDDDSETSDDEEGDVSESDDEEDEDDSDSDSDDEDEDDEVSESADEDDSESDDDADDSDSDDEDDDSDSESDDDEVSESDDDDEDDEDDSDDDAEAEESESNMPVVVASAKTLKEAARLFSKEFDGKSLSSGDIVAEHKVCSNAKCGQHLVMEVQAADMLTDCPHCKSALMEPSTSSDNSMTVVPDDDLENTDVAAEDAEGDDSTEEGSDDSESVEADPVELIEDGQPADDLDVSYSSNISGQPRWTAYIKGVPVAMASESEAAEANRDVFNTSNFGKATLVAAATGGVKAALKEMGFKGLKQSLSVNKALAREVQLRVEARAQELAKEKDVFVRDFMASLATAAVGINKGFFKDESNPIKMQLWNALSSAGIQNPEVLIDQAFKVAGDEYHRTLLSRAEKIASMSSESKDQLATAILDMSYQSVSSGSPKLESTSASVEDRLSSMGQPVGSVNIMESNSSGAKQATANLRHSVVKSLGRHYR